MRAALVTATLYLAVAIALAAARPLWLDEVLQLIETRGTTTHELLTNISRNSGAAPLGYFTQQATLRVIGFSTRNARLPAALLGAASVFLVALLGAELGLKQGWIGALIFGVFPLTLRYATEAREYSQALFFSILATWLYVRVSKKPGWLVAAAYAVVLLLAAYTEAYAASVAVAHIAWALLHRDRKSALLGAVAFALTIGLFLPWYVWSKAGWINTGDSGNLHFAASWKTPLMLFREGIGAGYWGSAVLLGVLGLAIYGRRIPGRTLSLLALLIVAPVVSCLIADRVFDYFIAARQFLWTLPAVAILAAYAIEEYPRAGMAVAALLAVLCVYQSEKFYTEPRENWEVAARALSQQIHRGVCVTAVPPKDARIYEFFRPELHSSRCPETAPPSEMVLAITPYTKPEQRTAADAALKSQGYLRGSAVAAGGSVFVNYQSNR